jgi:hypothetical protein
MFADPHPASVMAPATQIPTTIGTQPASRGIDPAWDAWCAAVNSAAA